MSDQSTLGRQQQLFTAWLASLPEPPLRQDKAFLAYQAGWRDSGAEKLKAELARTNQLLYGK